MFAGYVGITVLCIVLTLVARDFRRRLGHGGMECIFIGAVAWVIVTIVFLSMLASGDVKEKREREMEPAKMVLPPPPNDKPRSVFHPRRFRPRRKGGTSESGKEPRLPDDAAFDDLQNIMDGR